MESSFPDQGLPPALEGEVLTTGSPTLGHPSKCHLKYCSLEYISSPVSPNFILFFFRVPTRTIELELSPGINVYNNQHISVKSFEKSWKFSMSIEDADFLGSIRVDTLSSNQDQLSFFSTLPAYFLCWFFLSFFTWFSF